MRLGQFTKVNLRANQKQSQCVVQWPLLKYIMQKQQIQQMSSQSEDNGLIILFKLKHLIFPQIEDEEQIISIIELEPVKTIDKVLTAITQYYSEKLSEIIEPLEEDKNHLLNRLQETKQKLQHSLEDNQHFKNITDRLQEEKKDIECMLNQSQDDIKQSYQQYKSIIGERQKLMSQAKGIYESNQILLAENRQLKDINLQIQKQLINIKEQLTHLSEHNQKYQLNCKRFEQEKQQLYQQNCKLRQENDGFMFKINQKEQFIASFINDYNKVNYFHKQQDSFNQSQKIAIDTSKDSENNQLKGFNFNDFDKETIKSEKSSKNSQVKMSCKEKSNHKQGEVEQKFLYVNATAQKIKIPMPSNITGSENKSKCEVVGIKSKKENVMNTSPKIIFECTKESRRLPKAASSNNLHSQSIVAPSDTSDLRLDIEEVLRKKLLEKNVKILLLQKYLKSVRALYISQRQRITEMQGNYEIQVSQLKQEVTYLKNQLNNLDRKYALANSQCEIYPEKVDELQSQLVKIDEDYQIYCEQLKRRCKMYIIKKLEQAQIHYETIRSYQPSTKKKQQPERQQNQQNSIRKIQKFYTEERNNHQDHQDVKECLSLKLHQDQQQYEQMKKDDGKSDIYSYQHVENHYINGLGFDLQLSITNKNNDRETLQEIYIKENFQIQSDLGGFTERLMERNKDLNNQRGNLTDRVPAKLLKSIYDLKTRNKITLESNIYNVNVDPQPKNIGYYHLQELIIYPSLKKMQFSSSMSVKVSPLKKEINLSSKAVNIKLCHSQKINRIFLELSVKVEPYVFEANLKLYKLENLMFLGKHKHLEIQSKVFTQKKYKHNSKNNIINKYTTIYSSTNNCPNSLSNLQTNCTQTETYPTGFSQFRKKSNLSISKADQSEFCYVPLKSSKISQYISEQFKTQEQLSQLSQVKSIVEIDNNSQKNLIVSRLDQFVSNEIEEKRGEKKEEKIGEKKNNGCNADKKYKHVRCESVYYQQVIVQQKKQDKKIQSQPNNLKVQDIEQHQTIKQKTIASTVQTYGHWYQVDKAYFNPRKQQKKQSHNQNSPIDQSPYHQQPQKGNLNKGMILSNINSQKAGSQKNSTSFNPESKHNRAATQISNFNITPWFIDEKRHVIVNNQIYSLEGLPSELRNSMKAQNLVRLGKFLKQNRVVLTFLQQVKSQNFKKPQDLTKKMLILQTTRNGVDTIFLLAKKFLYRLDDMNKITINGQIFINQSNFCLGQSEILITKYCELIVNRKGKVNIMPGNIEDGVWLIKSYTYFSYRSKK